MKQITQNIQRLRKEIPSEIRIMAVTKNRSIAEILEAISAGLNLIGENRIQEAKNKFPHLPINIKKHLIGHLQTNKAKDAVKLFDLIESVDSEKLARELDKQSGKLNKKMRIYVQVNVSHEPQKSGILPEDLYNLIKTIQTLQFLELKGLMAIAEDTKDLDKLASQFKKMHELKIKYKLEELSMGMSHDYQEAIKYGSTQVRLGSIIFS